MTATKPPPPKLPLPPDPYRELVKSLTNTPLSLEEVERAAIEASLVRSRFNVSAAAKLLGLGRTTIYRKLKQYGFGPLKT